MQLYVLDAKCLGITQWFLVGKICLHSQNCFTPSTDSAGWKTHLDNLGELLHQKMILGNKPCSSRMFDRQIYGQFMMFYAPDLDDLINKGTMGTPPKTIQKRLQEIDCIADVQMDSSLPHGYMELRYQEGFFSAKLMYSIDETEPGNV